MPDARLRWWLAALALGIAAWTALAVPAHATYGGRTTADEPQYLLSALSLAEDLDLDLSDELRDERWRDFHEADLPVQTEPNADGREVSPHDPLLPVVLAAPMAVGGWMGAKLALAALAGALAAATAWVAVRRFAVSPPVALGVAGGFAASPPLVAYGTQVYPELPAALAVTVAVGALTGPLARRGRLVLGLAVVALPWLAVKYVPVAGVLALLALVALWRRGDRPTAGWLATALAAAGVAFVALHRVVYGGWTVYAAGDHFAETGEASVVGVDPDYLGRTQRVLGLLVDRSFGLVVWAPVFLLAVVALGALARRRPPGWPALALPLAAGWATATWVALTMHGWWWPGRQVVVVVPLAVVATAWWLERHRRALAAFALAAVVGAFSWLWLVAEVLRERLRLIIDFDATTGPWVRLARPALPDFRQPGARTAVLAVLWAVVLVGLAAWGWRSERRSDADAGRRRAGGQHQDAGAGEVAEPHVATVDLDREGAVG
ncbi:MAG: hypothetical protein KDB10_18640 [Acidimicrobiales bacterium]|nr:hypothetical protein [Acidimicrobiales bacterium]